MESNHVLGKTKDGFISYADGSMTTGLNTAGAVNVQQPSDDHSSVYDVIIIGAGFTGLVAARELSHRGYSVLVIEARDRIGGRTMATQVEEETYEMGGAWVHWSQPHVWTEVTRYGLSITETKGTWPDRVHVLLDHGTRLKILSMADLWPKLCELMNIYHDVDGVSGRTVLPLPHTPLAALDQATKYDRLSMQDRLDQISDAFHGDDEMKQIMDAYLAQILAGQSARWWFPRSSPLVGVGRFRFWTIVQIRPADSRSAEEQAHWLELLLNDCRQTAFRFSTPIISVDRSTKDRVTLRSDNGQSFTSRALICTIPLNALHRPWVSSSIGRGEEARDQWRSMPRWDEICRETGDSDRLLVWTGRVSESDYPRLHRRWRRYGHSGLRTRWSPRHSWHQCCATWTREIPSGCQGEICRRAWLAPWSSCARHVVLVSIRSDVLQLGNTTETRTTGLFRQQWHFERMARIHRWGSGQCPSDRSSSDEISQLIILNTLSSRSKPSLTVL